MTRVPITASTAHVIRKIAGPFAGPALWIKEVAMSGAVPLKTVKLMLKARATPVKRTLVGNKSARMQAKVPDGIPDTTPANAKSGIAYWLFATMEW